jgi:hypothetical protein
MNLFDYIFLIALGSAFAGAFIYSLIFEAIQSFRLHRAEKAIKSLSESDTSEALGIGAVDAPIAPASFSAYSAINFPDTNHATESAGLLRDRHGFPGAGR